MNKLSWVGTVSSIVGSFAVAAKFLILGYCTFLIGVFALVIVFGVQRNKAMITQQVFFLAANILGLYNALV